MIKLHKIEDGDVIKILPIIDENGNEIPFIEDRSYFYKNRFLYDKNDFLQNYHWEVYKKPIPHFYIRYFYLGLINDEIKVIKVGRTLHKLISENKKCLDLRSDLYLNVATTIYKIGIPSYNNSHFTVNVNHTKSSKELFDMITNIDYNKITPLKKFMINDKEFLNDIFGTDFIKEMRNKKLKELLN